VVAQVEILKSLKAKYKVSTGRDYTATPAAPKKEKPTEEMAPVSNATATPISPEAENVVKNITAQGTKIRDMKASKATKVCILFVFYFLFPVGKIAKKPSVGVYFRQHGTVF